MWNGTDYGSVCRKIGFEPNTCTKSLANQAKTPLNVSKNFRMRNIICLKVETIAVYRIAFQVDLNTLCKS